LKEEIREMSGGHFDYLERRVFALIEQIEDSREMFLSEFDDKSRQVAEKHFDMCADYLLRGATLLQRIDYVISGDDGPDSFFVRVAEDMCEMELQK
jgi:hypothetical protein